MSEDPKNLSREQMTEIELRRLSTLADSVQHLINQLRIATERWENAGSIENAFVFRSLARTYAEAIHRLVDIG